MFSKKAAIFAILSLVLSSSAAAQGAGKGGNKAAGAGAGAAAGGDPQTSTTLLQSVIATGFANDGQSQPTAGQVPSLTSTNNFINFCATVPQMPITNGKQIKTGSCNPAPMGAIPSTDKMPASKFVNPKNGATLPANTNFTIQLAIRNIETGHFTNAQQNYLAAPQQLNAQGVIQGHSHVVIEKLNSLDQTTPTDPNTFAFFKGLNDPAVNGVLSVEVGGGLPEGVYRIASINAAMNHQPALVAVAQHGSLDDMAYFTVTAGGAGAGAGAAAGAGAGAGAAAGAAAGAGAAKGGNAAAAGAAAGAAGAKAKPAQGKGAGAAKGAAAGKGAGAAKGAAAGKGFGGRFSAKGQGKSRF